MRSSSSVISAFFAVALALLLGSVGCSVETGVEGAAGTDDDLGEDLDPAVAEQALSGSPLALVPIDTDVPTGNLTPRVARLLTDGASTRALLGGGAPSVNYSRNWLVAFRPASKTASSRVQLTRAQLSRATYACGLVQNVSCTLRGAACPPATPICHRALDQENGVAGGHAAPRSRATQLRARELNARGMPASPSSPVSHRG